MNWNLEGETTLLAVQPDDSLVVGTEFELELEAVLKHLPLKGDQFDVKFTKFYKDSEASSIAISFTKNARVCCKDDTPGDGLNPAPDPLCTVAQPPTRVLDDYAHAEDEAGSLHGIQETSSASARRRRPAACRRPPRGPEQRG